MARRAFKLVLGSRVLLTVTIATRMPYMPGHFPVSQRARGFLGANDLRVVTCSPPLGGLLIDASTLLVRCLATRLFST